MTNFGLHLYSFKTDIVIKVINNLILWQPIASEKNSDGKTIWNLQTSPQAIIMLDVSKFFQFQGCTEYFSYQTEDPAPKPHKIQQESLFRISLNHINYLTGFIWIPKYF